MAAEEPVGGLVKKNEGSIRTRNGEFIAAIVVEKRNNKMFNNNNFYIFPDQK